MFLSNIDLVKIIILILSFLYVSSCSSTGSSYQYSVYERAISDKPSNINNICSIFDEREHWEKLVADASTKWSTDIPTIMAIIHQESSFNSKARPLDDNNRPLSSAYGYPQALDQTWSHYIQKTGNKSAKRDNFADAVDFVGWYIHTTVRVNNISGVRADLIYLNYHEGWGGFRANTYNSKPWLIKVSKKVLDRSKVYRSQLQKCSDYQSSVQPIQDRNSGSESGNNSGDNGYYSDWF